MKSLTQHLQENLQVNEDTNTNLNEAAEITSDEQFIEYGEKMLKAAHGDDYDKEKADDTLKGILKDANGDYGQAVGTLQASMSENLNESQKGKSLKFNVDDEDVDTLRKVFQKDDVNYEIDDTNFDIWHADVDKALKLIKKCDVSIFDEEYYKA